MLSHCHFYKRGKFFLLLFVSDDAFILEMRLLKLNIVKTAIKLNESNVMDALLYACAQSVCIHTIHTYLPT